MSRFEIRYLLNNGISSMDTYTVDLSKGASVLLKVRVREKLNENNYDSSYKIIFSQREIASIPRDEVNRDDIYILSHMFKSIDILSSSIFYTKMASDLGLLKLDIFMYLITRNTQIENLLYDQDNINILRPHIHEKMLEELPSHISLLFL